MDFETKQKILNEEQDRNRKSFLETLLGAVARNVDPLLIGIMLFVAEDLFLVDDEEIEKIGQEIGTPDLREITFQALKPYKNEKGEDEYSNFKDIKNNPFTNKLFKEMLDSQIE